MTHALKCHPPYFDQVEKGAKTFELRKEDRPFKEGDTILLQEYNPEKEEYTGKEISMTIGYILKDALKFGLKNGYCILGLKEQNLHN